MDKGQVKRAMVALGRFRKYAGAIQDHNQALMNAGIIQSGPGLSGIHRMTKSIYGMGPQISASAPKPSHAMPTPPQSAAPPMFARGVVSNAFAAGSNPAAANKMQVGMNRPGGLSLYDTRGPGPIASSSYRPTPKAASVQRHETIIKAAMLLKSSGFWDRVIRGGTSVLEPAVQTPFNRANITRLSFGDFDSNKVKNTMNWLKSNPGELFPTHENNIISLGDRRMKEMLNTMARQLGIPDEGITDAVRTNILRDISG